MHMEHPAFRVAFYGLTFLSVVLLIIQLLGPARLWMKGKPIHWKPDYLKGIIVNILGQKKVQGSRPRSGAPMHLMIFYGFLSLFLATTLLAVATYSPLVGIPNFHKGTYYLIFELSFDVLGLLFVIGIFWALGRRLAFQSKFGQKNPVTTETKDYVALVILGFLGLTGYVLEAARIRNHPQEWDWCSAVGNLISKALPQIPDSAYVSLWWFHYIWFFAFVAFLPQMRLKHIVTATLTAAGSPERPMGELVPVSILEVEQTGVIGTPTATDFSRWHLLSLDACMSCGRCTEVCPAHGVGKSLNPKNIVASLRESLYSGKPISESISEDDLWACTTCNACVEACPVLIRHTDIIVDSRRNLVAEGKLSGSAATMLRQTGSTGHAWGAAADVREDWMKGLDIPLARDGQGFDILFWVGCAGATDPGAVKTTQATAKLMSQAGIRFACLGQEETCTGDAARRVGDEFTFQAMAEANIETFKRYGVKKIVTPCPHCLNTLKNEYQQFGAELEVQHHTQLLSELVAQGRLHPAIQNAGSTTYHDPCYLARANGEIDAPRAILGEKTSHNTEEPLVVHELTKEPDAYNSLVEPEHFGKKTLCCGAGGGRMWMEEEPGHRPSERRTQELLDTGAKTIAVSCPFCRIMLDTSLKQADDTIRLLDLAELLQDANR